MRLLGTAFGNLFGIIGNLVRMNQGWATILLQVGTSFLGLIEHVTALIIPLGQLLVLGHGFVLWVGLAVTGVVRFGTVIAGWGASSRTPRRAGRAGGPGDRRGLPGCRRWREGAGRRQRADGGDGRPGGVGRCAAVAALAALVYAFSQSKSAVQQWGDSVVTAAQKASTVTGAINVLQAGVAQSAVKVATAQKQLADSSTTVTNSMAGQGKAATGVTAVYNEQHAALNGAVAVHTQLAAVAGHGHHAGGAAGQAVRRHQSNALGLLSQAGITNTQIMDKSGSAWALIQQEVAATAAGFAAMGTQAGVAGNNMQVLDKQATDMYSAIQKVNSGWSTFTSNMTGTQSSFDTFAQGLNTMASNSATFSDHLGELTDKGKSAKVAIDSLTPAGIALNSAFAQQIGNLNTMIGSWRTAGISQDQFKAGIAASIAPLEQYAKGSQEATAQLVGMAQEAGYQGPVSLQALNKFLGITSSQLKNTSGDLTTMKNVVEPGDHPGRRC